MHLHCPSIPKFPQKCFATGNNTLNPDYMNCTVFTVFVKHTRMVAEVVWYCLGLNALKMHHIDWGIDQNQYVICDI